MQTVDERPETIHLYVVREEAPKPQLFPIFLSMAALCVLFTLCVLSPYRQPEERLTIKLPAVFLPLKVFTTSVLITPTGVKTYLATKAHGVLTIFNGSVFSQGIPQGMVLTSKSGIEIVTDSSVFVPAGNPPNFGMATVTAHTEVAGTQGNIQAYDINAIYGSALYIRNPQAFIGGRNSYSVKVETPQDKQTAIDSARTILAVQKAKIRDFLAFPCNESSQEKNGILGLSWTCQYVTYSVPSYMRITHIKLVGKTLFVDVVFVPRPRIIQFK